MSSPVTSAPIAGVEGIDVSKWQPSIDWPTVARSKRFAIVKATEGAGHVDPCFASHAKGALDAGMLVGAYHFARLDGDPYVQARHFVGALTHDMTLPPVLDLEHGAQLAPSIITAWTSAWLTTVDNELHQRCVLYSGPSYLARLGLTPDSFLVCLDVLPRRHLWLAHYGVQKPAQTAWGTPSFWQYAGNECRNSTGQVIARAGRCEGVEGDCDLNVWLGDPGSLERLNEDSRFRDPRRLPPALEV